MTPNNLVEYGILNESSDYRIHVCFNEHNIYVFETKYGVEAVKSGRFHRRLGYQPRVKYATSEGYPIPPSAIKECQQVQIPESIFHLYSCRKNDDTIKKGECAVNLVKDMLMRGLISLKFNPTIINEKDIQIKGIDIFIHQDMRIQVKCDYDGGVNGTGNLFLQTSEINPLSKH